MTTETEQIEVYPISEEAALQIQSEMDIDTDEYLANSPHAAYLAAVAKANRFIFERLDASPPKDDDEAYFEQGLCLERVAAR